MMGFIIVIHVLICVLLIIIILIQSGRGGGLVENFSGVESMFGPKTNAFLTRATTVLSVSFFSTCLILAFLSARQSRSLLKGVKINPSKSTSAAQVPETKLPAAAAVETKPAADRQSVAPETQNPDKDTQANPSQK